MRPFKSIRHATEWVVGNACGDAVLVYWINLRGETCWATFRRFALPQWVLWEIGTMEVREYA
jgi:hypothetical protein